MDPDDFEINATLLFKQEASQLTTVQDLNDALARYGYNKDDRISRRELALMYSQVKNAMEDEIFRLANSSAYSEAKEMRSRLTNLRGEFDNQQLSGVEKMRQSELEKFQQGAGLLQSDLKKQQKLQIERERERYMIEKSNEELFHLIETSNFDKTISKVHIPQFRGSKRLADLAKAEYNLNKSKAYDDAIKVRKMIEKIQPKEEEEFYRQFSSSIEKKREDLERLHKLDDERVDEKLKKIKWNELRKRELEAKILDQRIKNHQKDMNHMHELEKKLKPEMSVKPSALWQHRKGYDSTAASLRGQQLLDVARGKKQGVAVFAESLVERHDYDSVPLNTTTLYSSNDLSGY